MPYPMAAVRGHGGATVGPGSLMTGLLDYWSLADLTDAVGGRTLTNHGTVTFDGANGAVFSGSNYLSLAAANAPPIHNADFAIALWYKVTGGTPPAFTGVIGKWDPIYEFCVLVDSGVHFYIARGSSGMTNVDATWTPDNAWHLLWVWYDATANVIGISRDNGTAVTGAYKYGQLLTGRADWLLGTFLAGSYSFTGNIRRVGIWSRVPTSAERTAYYNGGAGDPLPFPVSAGLIPSTPGSGETLYVPSSSHPAIVTCEGDSLTYGYGATNSYPTQMAALLSSSYGTPLNKGISGLRVDQLNDTYACADVDMTYDAVKTAIAPLWAGTNDLAAGASAVTVEARLITWWGNRRDLGFKVLAFTITPRADAGWTGPMETQRGLLNTWLRANWATYVNGLVDLESDSRLLDPHNGTYYYDLLHMVDAGYGIVAGQVATAIAAL